MILLSSRPITKETLYPQKVFQPGQKINFAVINPKGFKNNLVRIQIIKFSDKVRMMGYTIEHARDIEIDPSKNFFINNFYIYSKGYFVLRVFSFADLDKPIIEYYFWVNTEGL